MNFLTRHRPSALLIGGFGGLLVLMGAMELGTLFSLARLRFGNAEIQQRFLMRNHKLQEIRSHIYVSGTFARDALLAPEPAAAEVQFQSLRNLRKESEAALGEYALLLNTAESPAFVTLRAEIEEYWNVLERTFSWTADERNRFRYRFFYEEVVPRRTAMLQVADRIETLNDLALKQGTAELDALHSQLQLVLSLLTALTLAAGVALAAFTIFHVLRLERESARRLDQTLSAQAGLQDLSARLVRAQEDERRSLSRELHDEIGQSFSAILMEVENLIDVAGTDSVRPRLESIRRVAGDGVNKTRDLSLLLRPSMLDDFGLIPALNWHVRETAKRTGMHMLLSAGEVQEDLPEEHKTCIYRIVQEALTNAARHAQAKNLQVKIQPEAGSIIVEVQDDGAGFEPQRVRGLGLLGMEERVRHLGGTFSVQSNPGRGTSVRVILPLRTFNGEPKNGSGPHSPG